MFISTWVCLLFNNLADYLKYHHYHNMDDYFNDPAEAGQDGPVALEAPPVVVDRNAPLK